MTGRYWSKNENELVYSCEEGRDLLDIITVEDYSVLQEFLSHGEAVK